MYVFRGEAKGERQRDCGRWTISTTAEYPWLGLGVMGKVVGRGTWPCRQTLHELGVAVSRRKCTRQCVVVGIGQRAAFDLMYCRSGSSGGACCVCG